MSKQQSKIIVNDYSPLYPEVKQKVFNLKKNYGYINYTLNHKPIKLRNLDKIKYNNYKIIENQKDRLYNNNSNKLSMLTTESNNNLIYTQNTLNNDQNNKSSNIWKSNLQFSKQEDFYCNNNIIQNESGNSDINLIYLTPHKKEKELLDKRKINIINTFNEDISRTNSIYEKKHILRDNKILYYSTSSNFKEKEKFNQIKNKTDLLLSSAIDLDNDYSNKKENDFISVIPIKNKIKLLIKAKDFLIKEGIDKNENNISKSSIDSDTNINLGFKKISPIIKNNDSIFDDLKDDDEDFYGNKMYKKYKSLGRPILFKSIPKPKLNVNSFSNLLVKKNNFL